MIRREGKPPVMLKSGAEPYEIGMLLACLLWGAAVMTGLNQRPPSSTRDLPLWGVYLFFALLAAGSALALAGVVAERVFAKLVGFYVERAAQCALVGLSVCYSVWSLSVLGRAAVGFVLLLAVIWGAGAWRIWRITTDLKKTKEPAP